ncbi:hypothetical protein LguiA_007176 [Lonicera macranthoides]
MEVFDENEWWAKIEQMKRGREQEMIVKRNFSRGDQEILGSHAYNKGKALVVSKVPLPNYRADLDEQHGSTQKEIRMSTETERRLENLLGNSAGTVSVDNSASASTQGSKQTSRGVDITKPNLVLEIDTAKERLSVQLKERQEKMKVCDNVKVMQSFREKLPASKVKSEFLKAVAAHQKVQKIPEKGQKIPITKWLYSTLTKLIDEPPKRRLPPWASTTPKPQTPKPSYRPQRPNYPRFQGMDVDNDQPLAPAPPASVQQLFYVAPKIQHLIPQQHLLPLPQNHPVPPHFLHNNPDPEDPDTPIFQGHYDPWSDDEGASTD